MVSIDPLGELNLPPGKLDSSHFWHGSDASPAGKWSIGSKPSLFLLPRDQLHLVVLVLLLPLRKARLGAHCGASHSEVQLRLNKLRKMGFC